MFSVLKKVPMFPSLMRFQAIVNKGDICDGRERGNLQVPDKTRHIATNDAIGGD